MQGETKAAAPAVAAPAARGAWAVQGAAREAYLKAEAERKRKREAEDKEGHTGWYSNPAGAATSKATIFKEGIGKYIADDKGKSAVVAAPLTMGGDKGKAAEKISISATAADDDDDIWANVVPVKKVKVQPKAGFGDFSGW